MGVADSEVLSETAGFAVISDVAPAVPGHVLIVTKSHYQALAKLPLHLLQALDPVVRDVRGRLDRIYGLPTVVFEHGMCDRGRLASCGIDHAHLHVLPLGCSLEDRFRQDHEVNGLQSLSNLPLRVGGLGEYLLLAGGAASTYLIAFPADATRQYFRRVVAEVTGSEFWNWSDDLLVGSQTARRCRILDLHNAWARTPQP